MLLPRPISLQAPCLRNIEKILSSNRMHWLLDDDLPVTRELQQDLPGVPVVVIVPRGWHIPGKLSNFANSIPQRT